MTCVFCGGVTNSRRRGFACCEMGVLAYDPNYKDEDDFTMTVGELREIGRRLLHPQPDGNVKTVASVMVCRTCDEK